jgi:hypothetical protein
MSPWFGYWEVLATVPAGWVCHCVCGTTIVVSFAALDERSICRSCGHRPLVTHTQQQQRDDLRAEQARQPRARGVVNMTTAAVRLYEASPIKRSRSTKAEVEARRAALFEIVQAMKPMTVRQVFYQGTMRGIIEKTEAGYTKVQTDLVLMRKSGDLPYEWLADNTRWQRKPRSFNGIEGA